MIVKIGGIVTARTPGALSCSALGFYFGLGSRGASAVVAASIVYCKSVIAAAEKRCSG